MLRENFTISHSNIPRRAPCRGTRAHASPGCISIEKVCLFRPCDRSCPAHQRTDCREHCCCSGVLSDFTEGQLGIDSNTVHQIYHGDTSCDVPIRKVGETARRIVHCTITTCRQDAGIYVYDWYTTIPYAALRFNRYIINYMGAHYIANKYIEVL